MSNLTITINIAPAERGARGMIDRFMALRQKHELTPIRSASTFDAADRALAARTDEAS